MGEHKVDTRLLILIPVLAINGLAGCTLTRVNGHVPVAISTHFQNAPSQQDNTSSTDLHSWWKRFQDPVLDDLISQALTANHDLKIAKARVREARTVVTVTESVLYPTIDLFSSGGREKRIDRIIGLPTRESSWLRPSRMLLPEDWQRVGKLISLEAGSWKWKHLSLGPKGSKLL